MAFPKDYRFQFDAKWRKQSAYGTARAQSDLTVTLPQTRLSASREMQRKIFMDCTGQTMREQRAVSRFRQCTLEIDGPGAKTIAGFFAAAGGVTLTPTGTDPKVQPIRILPASVHLMPVLTFRIGFNDGTAVGAIWKDVIVGKVELSAAAGQDTFWKLQVELFANYATSAGANASWPGCSEEKPLALYDSALIIDGVDRINDTRRVVLSLDNRPPTGTTPFVAGSLDVKRWYRHSERAYQLAATIIGIEDSTNADYVDLETNNGIGAEVEDTELRVGPPDECFSCFIPKGDFSLVDTGSQGFDGDEGAEEGVLNTVISPKADEGNADAPINFAGTLPAAQLTQQMLLTA